MTRLRWAVLALLLIIAMAYGWLAVKWQATERRVEKTEVRQQRITEIVQGTPGDKGEPGIGVRFVRLIILPAGSNSTATLSHQILTLRLARGLSGSDGRNGQRGRPPTTSEIVNAIAIFCASHRSICQGPPGKAGEGLSDARLEAAITAFMRSHVFVCTPQKKPAGTFTCRIVGN